MQRLLLKIHLIIIVLLIISGCKKYPEDENISLQTVKQRLAKHDWYYNAFFVNDIDSTLSHLNKFTESYSLNTRSLHFRIKKFPYSSDGSTIVHYFENSYVVDFDFSLRKNKHTVFIGINNSPFGNPFWIEDELEWKIRKLTKTDFIVEKEFNGDKYRLEFKN